MDLFTQAAEKRFEQTVAKHLRRHFREDLQQESDETLLKRIQTHIATARGYGLISSKDIIDFSALCILLGDHFHTEMVWAKNVLENAYNESVRAVDLKDAANSYFQQLEALHDH